MRRTNTNTRPLPERVFPRLLLQIEPLLWHQMVGVWSSWYDHGWSSVMQHWSEGIYIGFCCNYTWHGTYPWKLLTASPSSPRTTAYAKDRLRVRASQTAQEKSARIITISVMYFSLLLVDSNLEFHIFFASTSSVD